MITLGIILLIVGLIAEVAILWTIGIILLVIGLILVVLGSMGRAVGGRRHYRVRAREGRGRRRALAHARLGEPQRAPLLNDNESAWSPATRRLRRQPTAALGRPSPTRR